MVNPAQTIGIIGYGEMGASLHRGWVVSPDLHHSYCVISPSQSPRRDGATEYFNDIQTPTAQKTLLACDVVMLAVKPQIMGQVCIDYKPFIRPDALIISIAAGLTIDFFTDAFHPKQPIIRAMPNTPSAIGKGVTGYVASDGCHTVHIEFAQQLFETSGSAHFLDDERLMDSLSAVSGSGPAYLFYFTECITQAGIAQGLPKDLSEALARETIIGSAALLETSPKSSPAELREAVTSKGGTTQAALSHFMAGEFQDITTKALKAAVQRAKELS